MWRKIEKKVNQGKRLNLKESLFLLKDFNLLNLGRLANQVREKKNSQLVFYSKNLNINHTNICINACKFCAFSKRENESGAYVLSLEKIIKKVKKIKPQEVHIVGGINPKLPFSYFENMLKEIKKVNSKIFIQAFTAVEIDYFSQKSKKSLSYILECLKEAGLDSIPGGGAEIFSPRIRKLLCPDKINAKRWLKIMQTAHNLGINSNAAMLYGHIETKEEIAEHLLKLRELQDKTYGFKAFVPLAFHSKNTLISKNGDSTSGIDDLRILAASRLILDNFPHIKALWMYLGLKLTQVALYFGADDIGGTLEEEEIVHSAGAPTPPSISSGELERIIKESGRIPKLINSNYQ
ncbi:MAG: aminofutalosine synthase MqnE [Armatimonadetes bacterium]|nr:aminofutalosine synthase MqnE [Armatimonadota bacterium]